MSIDLQLINNILADAVLMSRFTSFSNADVVESEFNRLATEPLLKQATSRTSRTSSPVPHGPPEHGTTVGSLSSSEDPGPGNITVLWLWHRVHSRFWFIFNLQLPRRRTSTQSLQGPQVRRTDGRSSWPTVGNLSVSRLMWVTCVEQIHLLVGAAAASLSLPLVQHLSEHQVKITLTSWRNHTSPFHWWEREKPWEQPLWLTSQWSISIAVTLIEINFTVE